MDCFVNEPLMCPPARAFLRGSQELPLLAGGGAGVRGSRLHSNYTSVDWEGRKVRACWLSGRWGILSCVQLDLVIFFHECLFLTPGHFPVRCSLCVGLGVGAPQTVRAPHLCLLNTRQASSSPALCLFTSLCRFRAVSSYPKALKLAFSLDLRSALSSNQWTFLCQIEFRTRLCKTRHPAGERKSK